MPFRSSGRGAYGPQGQRVLKGPLAPVWVTGAGQVGTANLGAAVSVQLSATDDSGDAPTYTIASGSLPTGLSLSSSGLISGTLGGSAGTFTFTVNATDVNGRATTSGSFTFLSVQPAWTSLTFSDNRGAGSRDQASSGNITTSFSGTAPTYSVASGIISLTIPVTGNYTINAKGAQGGASDSGQQGGLGASITGTFSLTSGSIIKILVGTKGGNVTAGTRGGGGGGGTYVATNANAILVIAGGGGGGGTNQAGGAGQAGNNGASGCCTGTIAAGGSGGNGGGGAEYGSGGAGWSGNGANSANTNSNVAPNSFLNNGIGGLGSRGWGYPEQTQDGGFGGGGYSYAGAGGGGGYSGGGGGGWSQAGAGGGGGSFNNGSSQTNTTGGGPAGNGTVTFTRL